MNHLMALLCAQNLPSYDVGNAPSQETSSRYPSDATNLSQILLRQLRHASNAAMSTPLAGSGFDYLWLYQVCSAGRQLLVGRNQFSQIFSQSQRILLKKLRECGS